MVCRDDPMTHGAPIQMQFSTGLLPITSCVLQELIFTKMNLICPNTIEVNTNTSLLSTWKNLMLL